MLLTRAAAAIALCGLLIHAAPRPAKRTGSRKTQAADTKSAVAQRWMRSLTLRDKAAQLVVMPVYGEALNMRSKTFRKYQQYVRDLHVGGLIVTGRVTHGTVRNAEPYAMAALFNRLQNLSKVPLLVAADFERGASMRVNSTTAWPYNMAFAAAHDLDGARYEGAETAREARAMGVNWLFAPVADVNNNPDNPIINIRSYGENPAEVASFVKAYIEGAHSNLKQPVLLTAKHFPGHGDTAQDSHMGLARLEADRKRIDAVELAPFRAAIGAGVDAIMTAHMAVPALDADNIPATVSSKILTGLLRNELGYRGLIVTDAMEMQGLMQMFDTREAAVRALEAGADVLLIPRSAEEAIDGVVDAVTSGRISLARLEESVAKVLGAKAHLGLDRKRPANLDAIGDTIAAPEAEARAQRVADAAVTLVKDTKDLLPLRKPETACLIALTESRYGHQGWKLMEETQKRAPSLAFTLLDPKMSKADLDVVAQSSANCGQIVIAAYVSVSAYKGNVALGGEYPAFVNTLLAGKIPVTLAALGNPYLVRSFPDAAAYLTTYSTTPPSETALVKALFGEIPIQGRLPVAIPGVAKYGDGIQVPAVKTIAQKGS